jgi:hypothetical protein
MGSLLWTGVKGADQPVGPGPCENASCAIMTLTGEGSNVKVTNESLLKHLRHGWGLDGAGSGPASSPGATGTATP